MTLPNFMAHFNLKITRKLIVLLLFVNSKTFGNIPTYECLGLGIFYLDCYLCELHLTRENKDFSVIPHRELPEIKKVYFQESSIEVLTADVCEALPYITHFYADNLGLIAIEKDAFEKCGKITRFDWRGHMWKRLFSDPSLLMVSNFVISLNNNKLTHVDWITLGRQSNLAELNLGKNLIKEFVVKSMPVLTKLMKLTLSDNLLTDLEVEVLLKKVPELKEIHLARNQFDCARLPTIILNLNSRNITFDSLGNCLEQKSIDKIEAAALEDHITENIFEESFQTTQEMLVTMNTTFVAITNTTNVPTIKNEDENLNEALVAVFDPTNSPMLQKENEDSNKPVVPVNGPKITEHRAEDSNSIIFIVGLILVFTLFLMGSGWALKYLGREKVSQNEEVVYDYPEPFILEELEQDYNERRRALSIPVDADDQFYEYIEEFGDNSRVQVSMESELNQIYDAS